VIHFGRKLAPEDADIVATGPGPADGIAKEIAFETAAADRIEVIFDPELAPGGYAYWFVLDGWGTLGLALLKGYGKLEAQFENTLARFQEIGPFDIREPRPGYSYMNCFLHGSSERGEPGAQEVVSDVVAPLALELFSKDRQSPFDELVAIDEDLDVTRCLFGGVGTYVAHVLVELRVRAPWISSDEL